MLLWILKGKRYQFYIYSLLTGKDQEKDFPHQSVQKALSLVVWWREEREGELKETISALEAYSLTNPNATPKSV